ncbi:hypothetical protein LIBO111022_12240 [Listeria booriae]|uniref:Uncharacterized protein n=1 Tax=Listeria booriae TaxID=1552123 RepID=A0A099VYY8_9LIST|nr:hypothetical protein [Listeria booriae]KGL37957.1 hypothetical protein EP57_15485 [Listeria booriae]STY45956.1 Uncharacterised protein [Listeria booriae]
MKKKWIRVVLIVLGGFLILLISMTIINKTYHTSYDKMDATNQAFFAQLNKLYSDTKKDALWQGDQLDRNPTIFVEKGDILNFSQDTINGIRKNAYAVGVKGLEGKWYAQKIKMPDSYNMPEVYRLAITTPGIWETWNPIGNFSSSSLDETGKTIRSNMQLGDSSYVFFFKYGTTNIENPIKASQSAIPFFTHEAFHYTQQYNWHATDGNIDVISKDESWYSLLGLQYSVLDSLMVATEKQDKYAITRALANYIVVSDARREQYPTDYEGEKEQETIEGTATYVGIKASSITGGKPEKLRLLEGARRESDRKFMVLFEGMAYDPSFVSEIKWNRYDSGALLSVALDQVDDKLWQDIFNKKASGKQPYTLDDELHRLPNLGTPNTLEQIKKTYDFEHIQELSKQIVKGLDTQK